MSLVAVGPQTRIRLHPLAQREDGGEWIVGRQPTRVFVALPTAGVRALALLEQGYDVNAAQLTLRAETDEDLDLVEFVEDLIELEFVAEVDGRLLETPPPLPPSLPWLKSHHVRFALHPALPLLLTGLMAAAAVTLLRHPNLTPTYHDLLWTSHGSLVIGLGAAAGWSIVFAHELAHLAVARAADVPARIRFGTRLQFLVLQTDISGIEIAPRRHRLTAYLAGAAVNLGLGSLTLLMLAATPPDTLGHRLLAAAVLWFVLPLGLECMVFLRSDFYFVLQDLTGCRDLYGSGRSYARYLTKRLILRAQAADPSQGFPPTERRAVRIYSAVLVVGTTVCLVALIAFTIPADLRLATTALTQVTTARSAPETVDGLVVLTVLGTVHTMWALTRWRNRSKQRRLGKVP